MRGGPACSLAVGMPEVSNVSGMSAGFSSSGDVEDGEGESTTDGMRVCPRFGADVTVSPAGVVIVTIGGGSVVGLDIADDGVGAGAGEEAVGSQDTPGLTERLSVSPSLTGYSLRSLVSARALPLSRRRCASAGGAPGDAASWALIVEIASEGETASVKLCAGFSDLNVTVIVPAADAAARESD